MQVNLWHNNPCKQPIFQYQNRKMMNVIRNSSRVVMWLLVLMICFSGCKSKKKAMEAQAAAEKAKMEQEAAQKQREAEEQRRREAEEAAERARKGDGPTLLEFRTYRYKGHSMSDPAKYRTKEEVEGYKKQDPVEQVKDTILKNKYASEAELKKIEDNIKQIVNESVKFAEESPFPDPEEIYKDVYAQDDYPFITD